MSYRSLRTQLTAASAALLLAVSVGYADDTQSLDDLLGLDPAPQKQPAGDDTDKPVVPDALKDAEAVEPLSPGKDAVDLLKDAVREMDEVTDHIDKEKDAGPIAQRKQEDIIRKLEQLIALAKKQGGS